jgi:hypothetical protein
MSPPRPKELIRWSPAFCWACTRIAFQGSRGSRAHPPVHCPPDLSHEIDVPSPVWSAPQHLRSRAPPGLHRDPSPSQIPMRRAQTQQVSAPLLSGRRHQPMPGLRSAAGHRGDRSRRHTPWRRDEARPPVSPSVSTSEAAVGVHVGDGQRGSQAGQAPGFGRGYTCRLSRTCSVPAPSRNAASGHLRPSAHARRAVATVERRHALPGAVAVISQDDRRADSMPSTTSGRRPFTSRARPPCAGGSAFCVQRVRSSNRPRPTAQQAHAAVPTSAGSTEVVVPVHDRRTISAVPRPTGPAPWASSRRRPSDETPSRVGCGPSVHDDEWPDPQERDKPWARRQLGARDGRAPGVGHRLPEGAPTSSAGGTAVRLSERGHPGRTLRRRGRSGASCRTRKRRPVAGRQLFEAIGHPTTEHQPGHRTTHAPRRRRAATLALNEHRKVRGAWAVSRQISAGPRRSHPRPARSVRPPRANRARVARSATVARRRRATPRQSPASRLEARGQQRTSAASAAHRPPMAGRPSIPQSQLWREIGPRVVGDCCAARANWSRASSSRPLGPPTR